MAYKIPDSKIQEKYNLNPGKSTYYSFGVVSAALLLTGFFLFLLSLHGVLLYVSAVLVVYLATYLGLSYLIGIRSKHRIEPSFPSNVTVLTSIDVFVCTCGEPVEIISRTLRALSLATIPQNIAIKVYVLDDADDKGVAALAYKYGYTYLSRPNRGEMKKAGNLKFGFENSSGNWILVLDADMAVTDRIFVEANEYLSRMEPVGIYQFPQYFNVSEATSWVEKGAIQVQELFYRLIQRSRDYFGAAICVGTNAFYLRQALRDIGGFYQIGYSEDLHNGFKMLSRGWHLKYVPKIVASGVCPNTVRQFFSQQYRWCMGSMSLVRTKMFWQAKITLAQRLCYLSGFMYYLATAFFPLFVIAPGAIVLGFFPEHVRAYNWLWALPSFIFGTLYLNLWSQQGFSFAAIKARSVQYWAHLFALFDILRGNLMEWVPTGGSVNGSSRFSTYRFLSLCLGLFNLCLGAYLINKNSGQIPYYEMIPYAFFNLFHSFVLLRAPFSGKVSSTNQ